MIISEISSFWRMPIFLAVSGESLGSKSFMYFHDQYQISNYILSQINFINFHIWFDKDQNKCVFLECYV